MIYPLNIFSPDPNGQARPFIIFMSKKPDFNVAKSLSWADHLNFSGVVGAFVLPFTNNGLIDEVTHDFGPGTLPAMQTVVDTYNKASSAALGLVGTAMQAKGLTPDPLTTNIYRGTAPRSWSGTWRIIPQSAGEAASVALILYHIKKWGSPDRTDSGVIGMLTQPNNYKIIFGNPAIQMAMQFNEMALQKYSINYFAQGYASTYMDGTPKMIELTLQMSEFKIKYKKDW